MPALRSALSPFSAPESLVSGLGGLLSTHLQPVEQSLFDGQVSEWNGHSPPSPGIPVTGLCGCLEPCAGEAAFARVQWPRPSACAHHPQID